MVTITITTKTRGASLYTRTLDLQREDLTVAELIDVALEDERAASEVRTVQQAQQAFLQGTYTIIVDGEQACKLDETVRLHSGSRVTFLRLMPLVGG